MQTSTQELKQVSRPLVGVPEVAAYVERHTKFVDLARVRADFAREVACIDGRRDEPGIGFPGGGIGVMATVLAGCNYLISMFDAIKDKDPKRAQFARDALNFPEMASLIERCMGGMSWHTDDEAEHDPIACKGCKHAMACLDGGYGLGEEYRAQMEQYLREIKKRAQAGDSRLHPDTYHGKHNEQAVLRVLSDVRTGEYVAIPPTNGKFSAFVFNEVMAKEMLRYVGGLVYDEKRPDFKNLGVSKEEFLIRIESIFYHHLRLTAPRIAQGLPVFDVIHYESGRVRVQHSQLRY